VPANCSLQATPISGGEATIARPLSANARTPGAG
jgi:hypothetical protein